MIKNMNEQERREAALASFGGEVLGATEVASREVRQMLSVRMEPELIGGLREIADARGVKVSDVLREAAAKVVTEYHKQEVTFQRTWATVANFELKPIVVVSQWAGQPAHGMTYHQEQSA